MRGKAIRTRKVRWLAALLGAFVLALSIMPVTAWAAPQANSLDAVYVSADGDDVNGSGTQDSPLATLAKAVEVAIPGTEDNPTEIYVMSDLEMTAPARYWNKHISISSQGEGAPFTVARGNSMADAGDPARLGYNSAMIEVNGSTDQGVVSTLLLTDIIFDDGGISQGKYFIQASTRGSGTTDFGDLSGDEAISNSDIVQDSMIAVYNGVGRITLGNGAVLKNYGGMSAVRLSSGELVMQSGSVITDNTVINRTQGEVIPGKDISDLYGPAGAIWMQGGTLVMEKGSEITGIVGRSIFNEGGTATINGTISSMVADPKSSGNGNSDFWHGNNGAAIYLRSEASATLGPTGVIDGEDENPGWSTICVSGYIDENGAVRHCTFAADKGSTIRNIIGGSSVIDVGGTAYLNGEITGLKRDGDVAGHAIVAQSSSKHYIRIGETANIHDNVCAYGVIYTQGSNGVIDIYGKINDNVSTDRGGALVLANNGTHVEANMYEGAEMCNNVSYQTGGAVMVSCGKFTMYGGKISGNISGAGTTNEADQVGGGVYVRRGGQFIMNGGEITDNSASGLGGSLAINLEDYRGSTPFVELNGGEVSGGNMDVNITSSEEGYVTSSGVENDITITPLLDDYGNELTFGKTNRYLKIDSGFTLGNKDVLFSKHNLTLDGIPYDVKFGNASTAAETKITQGLEKYELTEVVGSFWFESDLTMQSFTVSGLTYDEDKPLFAAMIKTDAGGLPVEGAEVLLQAVTPTADGVRVLVDEYSETGYVVSFVQQNDESGDIVTVTPADMTVYMGGDEGYEGVGEEGSESSSLPRPVFLVYAPADVDLSKLTFTNKDSNHSWTLKEVEVASDTEGTAYYRFEPVAPTTDPVRVEYNDGTKAVSEDNFSISEVEDLYKEFSIGIYAGETSGMVEATEPIDTSTDTPTYRNYNVISGTGLLTVRAVSNSADESIITSVRDAAPGADETAPAVAVVEGGTTYTLNDTGIKLPSDATPSLLFDEIITSDGVPRDQALKDAVDGELGEVDDNHIRNYDLRYLDLVDAKNGNAWITSSKGVDIYWAYPDGTDGGTEFTLLHFKGLHRDGDNSGFDVNDVENVDSEEMTIVEKTEYGIKFHVGAGGFSPFALVWNTEARIIEASAGNGGSISPSGRVKVPLGADQTFAITANQGYEVADVTVDGTSVGAVTTYTFSDVKEAHTIKATFRTTGGSVIPSERYTITATAGEGGSISPSGTHSYAAGSDVSFSITPDEGYTVGSVTVDGVDVGQRSSYTFADLDDDHTISVTFMPGSAPADPDDTGVSDWLQTDEHVAYLHGYGDGSGKFGPENPMTRAEVAQMFYNLLLDKGMGDRPVAFEDVPEGAYYAEAVRVLASRGILNGTGPATYEPDRAITRAEFVAIAMRFSNGEFEGENAFVDVPEDAWYRDYVVGATSFGWIYGYQDGSGRFGPDDTITRGQATMVTNRMLGRVADGAWIVGHLDDVRTFADLPQGHYAFFDVVEATNAHGYERDGRYEDWTGLAE
ncbi:S-layer homology domain-containing protein [Thermophilibacter mediterraneus]|uniref:S-layer homology domain-containing protein n=1 Tax=Thermophilibacter mediterraneus TaxID=1871031 RepID=UPI00093197A0|nr:S-layer homology domain-containing protein [Thermophilibacter mediterraneus]